jgi:DNA replication protein DnaC
MASNCVHCQQPATPVWDTFSKRFKPEMSICLNCFESKQHHSFPFDYKRVFEKNNWVFTIMHPEMPELFRSTDPIRMSEKMRSIMLWEPSTNIKDIEEGRKSLLIHGVSGTGKTRAAWIVFQNLWQKNYPKSCKFLTMRELDGMLLSSFKNENHDDVMKFLINVNLLVLDDLGKERLTNRMESDLFAIIDERANLMKTTIITSNYNGQSLMERFSNEETGHAIVRRLRDYYEIKSA